MPQKKENLPVKVDVDLQNGGTITYANEVIATIAGVAANEVDGIAGMCISGGFSEILSRNRNITRGVKVEVGSQEAAVDLYIIVEYGKPIQRVATDVQENVRKALESLTGLHVVRVDVHVQGVSFEKEKKAAQSSIEAAKQPILTPAEPAAAESPAEEPKAEEIPVDEAAEEAAAEENAIADEQVLSEEAALEGDVEEAKAEACCCEAEKTECECCEAEKAECCAEEEAACDAPAAQAAPEEAPAKKGGKRPGGRKRS
ncbi:MAG: Asp23/Gls24 family envelope stress response protein [Clostridia bacterium]|nr:Asp23/Gls24 family envelope stress response protein [Clostridiales bacterium]MBQ4073956.1 Asp23/Gls24 family envelope stress response protein [Clostridia bacterium]